MASGYKSATTQRADVPQDWWRLFEDPTLTSLIERALANNQDLQGAMARVEQARASAGIARAQFFPTIGFNPGLTIGSTAGRDGGTERSTVLPIDVDYEVDLWGRVRRQFEAAKADTRAAISDFGLTRLSLTTDVATLYFNLRSLDTQYQISAGNIALYQRQLNFLTSQTKAGFAAPLDVIQVKTLLESTQATLFDLLRQRANTEHALAILLGLPPRELDVRFDPLKAALPPVPSGLPADLLRDRPDLAAAEQNLIAANARVGEAITGYLPTVTLGLSVGIRNRSTTEALRGNGGYYSFGPALSIPLFDPAIGSNVRANRAVYAERLAAYRQTLLGAFRDVEDALTNIDLQARQAEAQDRAVADAREYVRLAEIQNRQGIIAPLQVLDADRTLLQNELTAAQILNARMASIVQLIRALGGGWSPDLPPAFTPTTLPTAGQQLTD
jgi:NodT family efflux transporter outer membrane factor (OMF) lipoprotein